MSANWIYWCCERAVWRSSVVGVQSKVDDVYTMNRPGLGEGQFVWWLDLTPCHHFRPLTPYVENLALAAQYFSWVIIAGNLILFAQVPYMANVIYLIFSLGSVINEFIYITTLFIRYIRQTTGPNDIANRGWTEYTLLAWIHIEKVFLNEKRLIYR